MRQFAVEIPAGTNWTDLKLTSFKEILVTGRSLTSSQSLNFDLAIGRSSLANTATNPYLPDAISILREIKIPHGATLCYSNLDVGNIKKELGSDKNDDYTILVRVSGYGCQILITA